MVPLLILAVVAIVLSGGSVLYASKYGYRALLSRVFPFAAQEEIERSENGLRKQKRGSSKQEVRQKIRKERKNEAVLPPSKEVAVLPAKEASSPKTESPGAIDRNVGSSQRIATSPPPAPSRKGEEPATGLSLVSRQRLLQRPGPHLLVRRSRRSAARCRLSLS